MPEALVPWNELERTSKADQMDEARKHLAAVKSLTESLCTALSETLHRPHGAVLAQSTRLDNALSGMINPTECTP